MTTETWEKVFYPIAACFYFIFFIITLIRWILLLKRTKQLFHQKIFFLLIGLLCLSRTITLLMIGIPSFQDKYDTRLQNAVLIESNFMFTAFLLIIFSLNNLKVPEEIQSDSKQKMIFLGFIIVDTVFVIIFIYLIFVTSIARWFLAIGFLLLSIGFLIYSFKLRKNLEDAKKPKKFYYAFLFCTISFLLRIPLLVLEKQLKTNNQSKELLINIYYVLFGELIPISLMTFYVFDIPIKPSHLQTFSLHLLNENVKTTN
ncbi:tobamovirus multiplication protein 1-like isoform x1 [Anaeramoeba ignava]|uniref:Tobamovirus multiplication protein 1-like isoform x1 n=1 Tax=Anaeramoeba ignava TaxID=1746090 RepID=A0A9Q0LCW0_ANAIG|nr:tobamovirus multiplication protein 1-like isoform x1 [Anaeramoeba ignava]